jgi:glucosyl-dolichyl phosphate glucuronosyltransferase
LNITVILCTYNRCQSLAKALGSVAHSVLPDSLEWEVLVVDNNSKDQTRDVVGGFSQRYPGRFRYLFEAHQGKSYALNAGIREARGDVLAFMDDDVTAERTWLRNLTMALEGNDCSGAGGRILPAQDFSPPSWLQLKGPMSTAGMLALFDLGEVACELHEAPFGTNMAFRKSIFVRYGGFRTDMGPCPGSEMRNEDTEFGRRLLAAGEPLRYEPSAIVYHTVPENRLQKSYFLAFWFDHGRASVREWKKGRDILGIQRYYFWTIRVGAALIGRTLRWVLSVDSQRRFFYKGFVWMTAGQIVEIYRRLFNSLDSKHDIVPQIDQTSACDGPQREY